MLLTGGDVTLVSRELVLVVAVVVFVRHDDYEDVGVCIECIGLKCFSPFDLYSIRLGGSNSARET